MPALSVLAVAAALAGLGLAQAGPSMVFKRGVMLAVGGANASMGEGATVSVGAAPESLCCLLCARAGDEEPGSCDSCEVEDGVCWLGGRGGSGVYGRIGEWQDSLLGNFLP